MTARVLKAAALFGILVACNDNSELSLPVESSSAVVERPNIIFIVADDLGYGDVGAYGQQRIRTPSIDKLASEGVKFTNHYAGSTVCAPSRASLLTGLHTGHSPIRGNPLWTASGNPVDLVAEDVTVAEMLKSAGYRTAVIGKWGLAENKAVGAEPGSEAGNEAMPNQQGFDYFFGYKEHRQAHFYYWDVLYRNNDPYILEGNDFETKTGQYTHDVFTDEVIRYVKESDPKVPFFLFLAYTIPHTSITVPEDSKQPYLRLGWPKRPMDIQGHYKNDPEGNVTYAGMVSRLDRDIGRLIESLKQKGIDDNTLVVFTSDNGPTFDDGFFNSSGSLRGAKRDLYEGGIRVPLIARWPGRISANQESDHVSAFWDFMATACELAKCEEYPISDGISYLPTLLGQSARQEQHAFLYWEFNEWQRPIQALRADHWKLIKFYDKAAELYDLSADPGETRDVATDYPEVVASLSAQLESARTDHPEFPLQPADQVIQQATRARADTASNRDRSIGEFPPEQE